MNGGDYVRFRSTKFAAVIFLVFTVFLGVILAGCGSNGSEEATEGTMSINEIEETQSVASSDWDGDESELLERLAMAKGGDTMDMAYNMRVVINRACSDEYPNSIKEIVLKDMDALYWQGTISKDCEVALRLVMSGWDETDGDLEWLG